MDYEEAAALSDVEWSTALELLSSVEMEMPDEWNGAGDSPLIQGVPGSNVEHRYNIRPEHGAEESVEYHYWATLVGDNGKMLVLRTELLDQDDLEGYNIEHDEEEDSFYRHSVWMYGDLTRATAMSMDGMRAFQFERQQIPAPTMELLDEVMTQWLQCGRAPDVVWMFLLTHLFAESYQSPEGAEGEDSAVTS